MARFVLLEFSDGQEFDVDDLVESLTEYNLPIMIKDGKMTSWREIHPTLGGVYSEITAIEGKPVD